MSEGTTFYCGDNCNHTGPHRYPPTLTSSGTSMTIFVSIPRGRRIRGRVKEVEVLASPETVHPGRPHRWYEMLHYGKPGTGFAECFCGAIGVPYRKPRP